MFSKMTNDEREAPTQSHAQPQFVIHPPSSFFAPQHFMGTLCHSPLAVKLQLSLQ